MKIKNKGKVHPSPSSSSSSSKDREVVLSVLKLLPAAILALASVLSLEDREVLAYLITRSLKTPSSSSSSSSSSSDSKKKSSKKAQSGSSNGGAGSTGHKPPVFDCDCFDCYTSYWVRWDSSPNRELIHQVIEAFEDHLTNGEKSSSKKINGRGKRRDKLGRNREAQKVALLATDGPARPDSPLPETSSTTTTDTSAASVASVETAPCAENAIVLVTQVEEKSPDGFEGNEKKENDVVEADEEEELSEAADEDAAVVLRTMAASEHKGLARKVLPDVLGLLNSRLWSLWSPNA